MKEYLAPAIAAINELNAYQLADLAGVTCPDSLESAGAAFLTSIRDSVVEQIGYYSGDNGLQEFADIEEPAELIDAIRAEEAFTEIADEAPSIYTFARFQQFTDLAAWQEDISELTEGDTDMEKLAGIALYMIADRLVSALLDDISEYSADN